MDYMKILYAGLLGGTAGLVAHFVVKPFGFEEKTEERVKQWVFVVVMGLSYAVFLR